MLKKVISGLLIVSVTIGFGKISMPLRVSLMGSMTGSGLVEIMAILESR